MTFSTFQGLPIRYATHEIKPDRNDGTKVNGGIKNSNRKSSLSSCFLLRQRHSNSIGALEIVCQSTGKNPTNNVFVHNRVKSIHDYYNDNNDPLSLIKMVKTIAGSKSELAPFITEHKTRWINVWKRTKSIGRLRNEVTAGLHYCCVNQSVKCLTYKCKRQH